MEAAPADVALIAAQGPEALLDQALTLAKAAGDAGDVETAMRVLRRAKAMAHLALAVGDLSGAFDLATVTGGLSDLSDFALAAAVKITARELAARGELRQGSETDDPAGPIPGLILIAMGKHGARELNYSSDIDVTVFFDRQTLPVAEGREPQRVAVRIAQLLVKIMEERTVEGYVFRTDLRLRPDPGATPPAVSTAAAEHYYQSLGQNWERAAFIKARACAADTPAGAEFLKGLESFLWRRHLDYAAIADIRSIKRQIRAVHGTAELEDPVFDVKLGRGGIRDIELFVQTQQLILGGRHRRLRVRATRAALAELAAADVITAAECDTLDQAYVFLRGLEHRIQMLEDEQTHAVPAHGEGRARLAALAGFDSVGALEAAIVKVRRAVVGVDARLFPSGVDGSLADPMGSLIFTGVENDPETEHTLARLGFVEPASTVETIRGWHHGRVRAMRAERARELMTDLAPALLRACAATGEADAAFARFAEFFAALNSGVQVLSLLQARPELLTDLCAMLALAPRLAQDLGRRPALLDTMLEPRFTQMLSHVPDGARAQAMVELCQDGFELALNAVRRAHREEAFRIDAQVLLGRADAEAAGAAHTDLAQACVGALLGAAERETARRFGPAPGRVAVLALGKFGGRELAEDSDLDLMVVYDGPEGYETADYYARLTQRLITALSAATEEGGLYPVDMQLRPSGSKGPVAVRLSAFAHYYANEAWTWELLALTRARAVAGDGDLGAATMAAAQAALEAPRDGAKVIADAADMRARMERERPAKSLWDLKLSAGGLVDLEFIAQTNLLLAASAKRLPAESNTGRALEALARAGQLTPAAAQRLGQAWRLYSHLQQLIRIAAPGVFDPAHASRGLLSRLAAAGGAPDFPSLEQRLLDERAAVRGLFLELVPAGSDGTA
jgi:glutamate-ammonia-ligase adenylyltransferase